MGLKDLYGFCMDSYGSLRSVCILYGCCIHMDSVWIQYILLDSVSVWILYGFCMDPDDIHGFCLDSVWVLSGFYKDSVLSLHLYGFCMYQ